MLELAQKYAKKLGTSILAHRIDGNTIIFVLASGPKLLMTEAELKKALVPQTPPIETDGESPKPKPKSKKGE